MSARERLIGTINLLIKESSPARPLSAPRLCKMLESMGISADRRSVYEDIAALIKLGWGVECTTRGYYLKGRAFSEEDASLLSLAADCAPFIDADTAARIKQGIKLTEHSGFKLPRGVERAAGGEGRLKRKINTVCLCIASGRQLSYAVDYMFGSWNRLFVEPIKLIYTAGEFVLCCKGDSEQEYIPLKDMHDVRPERTAVRRITRK